MSAVVLAAHPPGADLYLWRTMDGDEEGEHLVDVEWAAFKECCRIQGNLDLEAWDVMLFQPLKDLHAWWMRQLDSTRAYLAWLIGIGGSAAAVILGKIANIAATEVAGAFAALLAAVLAGMALGTMLDIVGRCLAAV